MITEYQKQLIRDLYIALVNINDECNREYQENDSSQFDNKAGKLFTYMAECILNGDNAFLPDLIKMKSKELFKIEF
ncbi:MULTISPECIES: hypothetical protein [Thermoanaerobacterium]|jgi:hypothetical protein|uniref:Uncharacterized protein n=1 Tax=Thermoanaerobacterium butyriciformans TaxID=1702242 RepID=A0ABS4NCM6_9THEO|nr:MULTISPECIES: hypothetical protein [Thermoanaerobacterium]MBE0069232.1 hypothetical protein [Thermoanaerobacterium thermosaccharolyticum]MBE0228096.1 hypothetical protein [Thermoanaerobacterium thermosaccharolyticum]MBP2070735.1 hypothetical protein [Thermoanaerobacterium butyriciformans]